MVEGGGVGYAPGMSDDTTRDSTADYDPDADPDTDATMTAPDEGRPDGSEARDDSGEPSAQRPEHSDAEVLESQEEERPSDE